MNREEITQALCALVFAAAPFQTTGRRLDFAANVAAQPACFVRNVSDDYLPRDARGLPRKVVMNLEIWLYVRSGNVADATPASALNNLVDAIDTAIQPPPFQETQTLGGLVSHAWIEGEAEYDPGDIGGQAIAVIPVKVLVPN